jgi:hypothetical protein
MHASNGKGDKPRIPWSNDYEKKYKEIFKEDKRKNKFTPMSVIVEEWIKNNTPK